MKNTTAEADVVDLTTLHLVERLHAKLHHLEDFARLTAPGLREQITEQAGWMVAALHVARSKPVNTPVATVERMARRICRGLFGFSDPPARFWSTPLGADIAWSIGYPSQTVPAWAAAAVCQIDRTYVYLETRRGRLELTATGVRDYIHGHAQRWSALAALFVPDPAAFALNVPSSAAEVGERTKRPQVIV